MINKTIIQECLQGTDFDIVGCINMTPHFLIPKIIALVYVNVLFILIGLVAGKEKKLITYPNFWYLFIPLLLYDIFFIFGELLPVYYYLW